LLSANRSRLVQNALFVVFFTQGFLFTSIIPRIPEFIERLHVDFVTWGLVTGLAGLGSLLGLTQTTRILNRFGSRRVNRVSAMLLATVPLSFPYIHDGFTWFLANFAYGLIGSMFNVSLNSQAISLQKLVGKVILGRYHAAWAIGAAASAGLSGLFAAFLPLELHYLILPIVVMVAFYFAGRELLWQTEEAKVEHKTSGKRVSYWKTPKYVWLLTAGLFLGMFPELVMMDWSASFAKDVLHVDATLGALPYTVFTGAMIIGRLSIGRLTKAFHFSELSKWGGVLGSMAMLAGVLIGPPIAEHDPVLALIVTISFWAVAGLGVSPMVPSFMSAGGYVKGMPTAAVISRMSLTNSVIVMGAKYVMGALAQGVGLAAAMAFPIICFFIAGIAAGEVAKRAKRKDAIENAFPPTAPVSIAD
jgi:MFS family permease